MKKFLFMLLAILGCAYVFACPMEEKAANEARINLINKGLTERQAEQVISAINDMRIALVTEGMTLEQVDALTTALIKTNNVVYLVNDTRLVNAVVAAQKNANETGFEELKVVGVTDNQKGIKVTLRKELGTNTQLVQINTARTNVQYSTSGVAATNQRVAATKQRIKRLFTVDDNFVPYKNTSTVTLNGRIVRFIPSKKVKSEGAGNVIVKDDLIKEK